MTRGQAEVLLPTIERVLGEAGCGWSDLAAVACCTGPGNFTGIRIAVSCVRGVSLAQEIPAIGVPAFEALGGAPGLIRAATAGRRYVWDGTSLRIEEGEAPVTAPLHVEVGRYAALRLNETHLPPAPVYIRPPDAALPSEAPPQVLD